MNILFYYPFNRRTIPIDVPLFELKRRGHCIRLLTLSGKGPLHEYYEQNEIETFTHKKKTRFGQLLELILFCKKNKIEVVHSHLQQSNLIAIVASKIMRSTRVIPFRHHCKFHHLIEDSSKLRPSIKETIADMIINRLAKKIVVPASGVRNAMIEREGVSRLKIDVIPYMYHFDNMEQIDVGVVKAIKNKFPAKTRIILASRMTPFKRHHVALEAIFPHLTCEDIQVLIMDDGPEMGNLRKLVSDRGFSHKVHFLGFQKNILEYIAAADIVLHPSLTDASNSVIKEAALFEKVVMVCNKVGDFNDYILHNKNGFLLNAQSFKQECSAVLGKFFSKKIDAEKIGGSLRQSVLERFSFRETIVDKYEKL